MSRRRSFVIFGMFGLLVAPPLACSSDPSPTLTATDAPDAASSVVDVGTGVVGDDEDDASVADDVQTDASKTACPQARAKVAPLTTNTLAFDSNRTGNHEIFVMQTNGTQVTQLTSDPAYDCWWPKISPDRTTILFTCAPKGPEDYTKAGLWLVNVDGSQRCQLRAPGEDGWTLTGHEEWSPDGQHIAIAAGIGLTAELFSLDANGKNPKQLTSFKSITTDVSWAPDGLSLLTNSCAIAGAKCAADQYEIFKLAGGVATRLTNDGIADYDPYYSPDQKRIAWLRKSDPNANSGLGAFGIYVMDANGTNQKAIIDDGQVNSKPAWSRDGSIIYFHRLVFPATHGFSVWSIHPDGTGLTEITAGQPGVNEFPMN